MKKLILLLLFIPLVSFGQDVNLNVDKKVEFSEKDNVKRGLGLVYKGMGTYTYGKEVVAWRATTKNVKRKQDVLKEEIIKEIIDFTSTNGYTYKIKLVENLGTLVPKVLVTFEVFNKDGSLVLNKDDAKKQLIELKEYLDLGIITQEEFDKKAVSLKKILLGN